MEQEMYNNIKRQSCGYDKKRYKKIKVNGKHYLLDKLIAKKIAFQTLVAGLGIALTVSVGSKVVEKVAFQVEAREATEISMENANQMLAKADLHVVPINGEWNNYYGDLDITEEDLYGLLNYLGYEESEYALKSLGYTSWDEYLASQGYLDKNGKPSIEVFKNFEEARLVDGMKEGTYGRTK